MKIRPGAVVEAALALAAGAALSFAADVDPRNRPLVPDSGLWLAGHLVEPFLAGVAVVGALGVLVEAARRRQPAAWGPGRWTWALAGLYLLLDGVTTWAQTTVIPLRARGRPPAADAYLSNLLSEWRFTFTQKIIFILLAFLIAARLARLPRDAGPDLRERAGRLFLGLALAWGLGFRAMIWAGA